MADTTTVTVACKLPHGLMLRAFRQPAEAAKRLADGRPDPMTPAAELDEALGSFVLNGFSFPQGEAPTALLSGGYAITSGVPKNLWDAWLAQNAGSDLVRNKLVFAHEKADAAMGFSREHAENKSGLERIDPTKPSRGIATATRG